MPAGWDVDLSDDYEWVPLRLPPDVTRVSASTRLSIEAEYRGWELTKVRLYTDGSRRVLLRRKKSRVAESARRRIIRSCEWGSTTRCARRCSWCRRTHPHAGVRRAARRHRTARRHVGGCDSALAPTRPGAGQHGVRGAVPRTARAGRRVRQGRPRPEHLGRTGFRLRRGRHRHRAGRSRATPRRGCSGCPPTARC